LSSVIDPRDKLKVLYWQRNGFCLWQKRLEEDKFSWPRKMHGTTLSLSQEQWQWLLDGLGIEKNEAASRLELSKPQLKK
jgi:transposase